MNFDVNQCMCSSVGSCEATDELCLPSGGIKPPPTDHGGMDPGKYIYIYGISSIVPCTLILKLKHTHIKNYNPCSLLFYRAFEP